MLILLTETTMLIIFIHPLHSLLIILWRAISIAVVMISSMYNIWSKVKGTIMNHSWTCQIYAFIPLWEDSIITNNSEIEPNFSLYYNSRHIIIRGNAVLINTKWPFGNRWPQLLNAITYFLAKMMVNSVYSLAPA